MDAAARYDALPYDTKPSEATHPDRLFALARLHGLDIGDVQTARVLELGCGTGANLLPMAAALPRARFVGVDFSSVQIAMGETDRAALGLDNIQLVHADLRDAPEGPYDLIVAHGVYSWVPDDVRDALLERIAALLAPSGVAFVSFNALPGWHVRGALRDLLRRHVRHLESPADQLVAARALVESIVRCEVEDPLGALVRERAVELSRSSDAYLAHDYLEDCNTPVYVDAFRDHAAAHGLAWLTEAELGADTPAAGLSPLVERLSDPALAADVLSGRVFHRAVLCRREAFRTADASELASLYFRGRVLPDGRSAPYRFTRDGEPALETENPLLAAALVTLAERRPGVLPFDALAQSAWTRIGRDGAVPDAVVHTLTRTLHACARHRFVDLYARDPGIATQLSDRPRAWSAARRAAAAGEPWAPSLLHRPVAIEPVDASLLVLLDGTRDRNALLTGLAERHPDLDPAARARIPERLAMLVQAGMFEVH